jgi:hypothetical protein
MDWKGEHFIRAARPTQAERNSDNRRIGTALWHRKRRAKGDPAPAQPHHDKFFRSLGMGARDDFAE